MKIIIDEPRSEDIEIVLKLPKDTPKKYRNLAESLLDKPVKASKNDSLEIKYIFEIEYFGRTVERFQNIVDLAEKGFLVSAELKVLNQKVCLIAELIRKIDGMQKNGSKQKTY